MKCDICIGDSREILKAQPDESVHCVVTSPPYWGLRDYGTGTWEGGDPVCDHGVSRWEGPKQTQGAQSGHASKADKLAREQCGRCGAIRVDNQLGLEQTPQEYVDNMVGLFREVRRVLRKDGTCWVNLGDSYHGGGSTTSTGQNTRLYEAKSTLQSRHTEGSCARLPKPRGYEGFKPKDLVGIPWRVAFALQADGWYLRQDIIWAKPNPMPESVTDRCTKAHEYIFLLTKAEKYWFDHKAIKEDGVCPAGTKGAKGSAERASQFGVNSRPPEYKVYDGKRNKRSVWTVTTKPFKGAHFATFPPDLIQPCILAGCPEGGTVLDPFGGAGTTGMVALKHRRNAILIELNPEYAYMAQTRIKQALGV